MHSSSLPDVPSNCSTEKKGHSNRCIAIGEQNSWYIHYQAHDEQKKNIERSSTSSARHCFRVESVC